MCKRSNTNNYKSTKEAYLNKIEAINKTDSLIIKMHREMKSLNC